MQKKINFNSKNERKTYSGNAQLIVLTKGEISQYNGVAVGLLFKNINSY